MRQLTKHDVNKLTAKRLEDMLPFEITVDGRVIAEVTWPHDVNKVTPGKLPELPFSKHKQAKSSWL